MKDFLDSKNILMETSFDFSSKIDIVVPLSGGKDSQLCLKLAKEFRTNILAVFCDTKFEHPATYQHIKNCAEFYEVPLVTLNAGNVLDTCLKHKRFPGGTSRHCTLELKLIPSRYFYEALARHQEKGFEVWCGMRTGESQERKKRYFGRISSEIYTPHEIFQIYPRLLSSLGVSFRLPILEWTTEQVFNYLSGEANPLYRCGFDRVGCFPCLASGEANHRKAFEFDETGEKHYEIAKIISENINVPVFGRKKFLQQRGELINPREDSGCSFCEI